MGKEKEEVFVRYGRAEKARSERAELLARLATLGGKPEALEDVVVLDVSYANFAGIITSSLLAEFGAEVIKIEPPEGDPARMMSPYGVNVNGVGIPFLIEARNKRYFTLDVRDEKERKDFKKLASKADILIETFPAGQMDSWGVGYRQLSQLNPGLIYIAITPYGQYTAKAKESRNLPDSDLSVQAASGLAASIGDPPGSPEPYSWPLRAGMWMGWYLTALSATMGGIAALIYKQATGEGQMVDMASFDAYSSICGYPPTTGFTWGESRPRTGPLDFILFPYGLWKTKDGWVCIAANRDQDFRALLKILNLWKLEDDWRHSLDRIPDNISQAMVLYNEIEKGTIKYTSEELSKKALAYTAKVAKSKWRGGGFPVVMKVQTPSSAMKEKHWEIRKSFQEIDDKTLGKFIIPANFAKMTETPPRLKWVSYEIGKDNEYIRKKYLQNSS